MEKDLLVDAKTGENVILGDLKQAKKCSWLLICSRKRIEVSMI